MDKDFLIQATNDLYRLTLFFPKKEPLRYKMREKANDILANSNNSNKHITKDLLMNDLKTLNGFFEVVKTQQWVSISDILVVQTKYVSLMDELEKEKDFVNNGSNLERQKKILSFLEEKGKVQIQEVKQIFPEVTKRTLRRDFEQMLNQGLIKRIGEKNNTSYELKVDVA
ncbi:DeoR family transcriptional regulator [Dehalococcoidia bacterium]|nr:DeoR family transcriptional regulator [Dehalococcoidia bacterium]